MKKRVRCKRCHVCGGYRPPGESGPHPDCRETARRISEAHGDHHDNRKPSPFQARLLEGYVERAGRGERLFE